MCWSKTFPFYVASGLVSSILEGWRFTSLIFFCVRWMSISLFSLWASSVSSNACQWWRGLLLPMLNVTLFERTKITLCTLARSPWFFFTALSLFLSSLILFILPLAHCHLIVVTQFALVHLTQECSITQWVLLTAFYWYDCVDPTQSTIYSLFSSSFWHLFMR